MAARWDGDDRGHGIGDAAQLVSGASELVAAFREPSWVAEQPEGSISYRMSKHGVSATGDLH
ncbi:MAG: hypothetical protein JO120_02095 [Solirubrobacterales bacterium]|nr:hypothetical protein [Solirubrobacterales bacterium]